MATIQALFPDPQLIADPVRAVAAESRQPHSSRPWLYTNMIASADGAAAIDGLSGALGGDADRTVFRGLRAAADVILVGATTVRAENYRPPPASEAIKGQRIQRGQTERPMVAVVTNSINLDLEMDLFSDTSFVPIIITSSEAHTAHAHRVETFGARAHFVLAGEARVDLSLALEKLFELGHQTVLSEGGPSINGQLVEQDLIDEWNLSISPQLAAGGATRAAVGRLAGSPPRSMELKRVWHGDDYLFCRWTRST